jgi:hypothetical protein
LAFPAARALRRDLDKRFPAKAAEVQFNPHSAVTVH